MIIKINFRKFTRNPALPLSFLNIARNQGRSMTVAALFAIGTFLVVSTGSNKMDLLTNANDKSGGTGGFNYFAETTIPVLFDINDPEKKKEEGIYEDFKAVQFHQVKGDDASCLNLNRISQPAVLGVDPHDLADRFGFATKLTDLNGKDPWLTLDHKPEDGWIPAIADQTVIQWGLGKKIGDVLFYQNEKGDTIGLKLIAGTLPSVFQGYIIISNDHFIENYPSVSGSSVFLIDPLKDNQQEVGDALHSVFRDYGWEMQSTAERLAGFYSVTNTYLSIFLALGALGLLLGTVGLAVVLARSLLERQSEIALMQALGFGIPRIFYIVTSEYALLLTAGILTGFIAAVIAVFPALSSVNTDISSGMISLLVIVILLNGLFWIMGLTWISLHKRKLTEGLRLE